MIEKKRERETEREIEKTKCSNLVSSFVFRMCFFFCSGIVFFSGSIKMCMFFFFFCFAYFGICFVARKKSLLSPCRLKLRRVLILTVKKVNCCVCGNLCVYCVKGARRSRPKKNWRPNRWFSWSRRKEIGYSLCKHNFCFVSMTFCENEY